MTDAIILSRVDSDDFILEGSVQIEAKCGCRCWASQAMVVHLASNPEGNTTCIPCSGLTRDDILRMIREEKTVLVKGGFDEIAETIGTLPAMELDVMGFKEER